MNNNHELKPEIDKTTANIKRIARDNAILVKIIAKHPDIDMQEFAREHNNHAEDYRLAKETLIKAIETKDDFIILETLLLMQQLMKNHWTYLRDIADKIVEKDDLKLH